MAKISDSTQNMMDLFTTHTKECDKIVYDDIEAQNECLICMEMLRDKEKVLKFVC